MTELFFSVDWKELFVPTESFLELFLRGTLVYLTIIVLLRIIHSRNRGMLSSADFLFTLFIAASSHYALTGGNKSITAGLIVILTIIFWNYVINLISYKSPRFKKFFSPQPFQIIKNGQFIKRNMRKEFITEEEVHSQLRQQGIKKIASVSDAFVENDGSISIILHKPQQHTADKSKKDI